MSTEYKLVAVGGGEGIIPLDTDATMAADSDKRVATQKAVKAAIATALSDSSPTELNFLDGATAGTQVASKAVIADANVNIGATKVTALHIGTSGAETQVLATGAEINYAADLSAQAAMAPAAGFLGTGTTYSSSVVRQGGLIKTTIYLDITGAQSSTTDLDIIGNSGVAYIGQITAAINGTIRGGTVTCLKAPTGGVTDIDLYAANEATGAYDGGIGDLAETALVTSGGAWALSGMKALVGVPTANQYLYLTCGTGGTPAAYTAGRFLIELWGTS